ncbi:MAG TPA: hypothetical protein VMF05_14585 [Stellaceae bacterium]|nr:hypothetical protein [Stellaceae bacterium]
MAHGLHDRIPVRRHPIAELDVFEVSGEELDQLERAGLQGAESFGFLIFGCSVGISLTITLATVEIHSDRLFESFLITTIIAYVVGVFFGIRWFLERKSSKTVAQRIRSRIGPIGDDEAGIEPTGTAAESERSRTEG